jgi:cytochrome b561
MLIRNTLSKYGIIAKSLHWLVALLIIGAWGVGSYAADLPKGPEKGTLFNLHKSVGMAILMLVIIRICWRIYDLKPSTPKLLTQVQALAAHLVHYLLYAFMLIQPLSGWAMSSAAGYPPSMFGLFKFPSLVAKSQAALALFDSVHEASANILLTLFILHVAGALYHHFILKDDTLRRII